MNMGSSARTQAADAVTANQSLEGAVRRLLRARSDWQVLQRMSANRNLNGRFWESQKAAAGHELS
jgi:hypothetical protein